MTRFLSGLLTGSRELPPEIREALNQLDALLTVRPALARSIAVLREVLPLLGNAPATVTGVPLTTAAVRARWQSGTPLLCDNALSFDVADFQRRWRSVCTALGRQAATPATGRPLARLLQRPGWNAEQLVHEVLGGQAGQIRARAETDGLEPEQVATAVRLTLFPLLASIAAATAAERSKLCWPHGYCPTCGSWPHLAEYRGLEQLRFLRCGRCASGWEFPRLQCPYCATRDHHRLAYLHVEGEELRARVATCDGCGGYVKIVATLSALTAPELLVTDLATTHLDLAALEQGFDNVGWTCSPTT